MALYSEVKGPERSYNCFTSLYICVSIVREKPIYNFLQSPTLYWVSTNPGRDSVCKSHYMHWLASQSSDMLTSLFLECVVILQLSPVWVQVQVQVVQV